MAMNTAEEVLNSRPLVELIEGLVELPQSHTALLNRQVTGVKMDSRLLQPGDLFIACFGRHHDARNYIAGAIDSGVAAVLAESGGDWQGIESRGGVPVIAVDNLSSKISEVAGRFYGKPSEAMTVIGVTGTNGKTSCSHFIAQVLEASGAPTGLIGTLGFGRYNNLKETQHTTPDAVFTQKALAEMQKERMQSVVMEVSSVGLHQHRVEAVKFDTALFTNLSRDHLDYHDSMENYADNKRKLFLSSGLRAAIINIDDSYGLYMMDVLSRDVKVYTYSLSNHTATVYAKSIQLDRHGFSAEIATPYGDGSINCPLFGYFNISNVLAALTTLISFFEKPGTIDIKNLFKLVSELRPVVGRMEIIGSSDELTCIVDYAHTPDGLKSALTAIRDHFDGKVWCVFGCGGNRDRGKRPMMGEIARAYANRLIITDDNPRKESGEEIVKHILSGIEESSDVSVIRDRAQAIQFAIESARPEDIVLVAGKGHENYQDIGGRRTVFSDANQVRLALQKRSGSLAGKG
jgi:UDP-N-acetylmuramoyl-L-alanyl-D-glutamate--2,6-diaminopimelate ligase